MKKIQLTPVEAEAIRACFVREADAKEAWEKAHARRIEVAGAILERFGYDPETSFRFNTEGILVDGAIEIDEEVEEANAAESQ